MPENEVPLEELRAAVLEPQDETAELVTAAFREGMSAGLDFAYRVTDDFRNTLPSASARGLIDRVLEVLVSEHDMRAGQPIRAIQVERAGIQAADAMLAGLSEALMTVQARNQEEVRAENTGMIRESIQPTPDPLEAVRPDLTQGCDGPCCRPEDDPGNVFNWVNVNPDHTSAPTPITPTYVRCMCGDVNMSHRSASRVTSRGVYHRVNAPCYVADDPEPENVQAASDERAALRLEHSCDCGAIPGLVGGMVPEGREDGTVVVHRPEGEPCTLGVDS